MSNHKTSRFRTLSEAVDRLKEAGYVGEFVRAGARLRHLQSGEMIDPRELTVVDHLRFEGVSDPDDMDVIYVVESTNGKKGLLIDAFGTYADREMAEVISQMKTAEKEGFALH